MGDADQFIKGVFRDETAPVTGAVVRFDPAPEIATPWLTPDGIFTLVGTWAAAALVLAPWTLFSFRAVVDFKMEGDHVDATALARVELRRLAAWVQHLEAEKADGTQTWRYATVVVAPHLPEWLSATETRGALSVTAAAPGCYVITPRDHPVVWVAANELPLHPSLVPFLWARSGRPRVEFVRWLAGLRGVPSVVAVIQRHPMGAQITKQLVETPEEQEVIRLRGLEMARILLEGYPEVANEIRRDAELRGIERGIEKGIEKGIETLRDVLYDTLRARGLRVSATQRARIDAAHDLDTLRAWARAAVTAKTTAAALNASRAR